MKIIPACITLVFVIIDTQALQRITFFVLFCFVKLKRKSSESTRENEYKLVDNPLGDIGTGFHSAWTKLTTA